MVNLKKQIEGCKHPNSRKTVSLTKQAKKATKRQQSKLGHHIKQNVIGEKVMWFREQIPDDLPGALTKEHLLALVEQYLSRFDEELEQIAIKNSVGNRKNRQHASRQDVINMTKARESEEFNTCGIELPDLLDVRVVEKFKEWDGELRFLQNFKMIRFTKKSLV